MPPVDPPHFRQLLGRFATGVAVLTTRGPDGRPVGTTVNSLTSVSLSPPLVLVCIDRVNETNDVLADAPHFALSILASDQEALSRRFAEAATDRFDAVGYRLTERGVPVLDGASSYLECERHLRIEAGDHSVVFGLVVAGEVFERRPLLYYRGGYASLPGG